MGIDGRALDRECDIFCRYLINREPNEYIRTKYREGHRYPPLVRSDRPEPSDRLLVKIAVTSPRLTRVVDAYASVFHPSCLVRKKLVLLLAILESSAATHAYLDSVDLIPVPLFFLRSLQRCLMFALMVVVGAAAILPLELAVRGGAKLTLLWEPRHG